MADGRAPRDRIESQRGRAGAEILAFLFRRLGLYLLILLAIVVSFTLVQFWTRAVYDDRYTFWAATRDGFQEVATYFRNWLAGRFGAPNEQVARDVKRIFTEFYPRSMGLLLLSFLLATPAGLSLGAASAFRRGLGLPRWASGLLLGGVTLGLAALIQLLLRGTVPETFLRWLIGTAIALSLSGTLWLVIRIARWAGFLSFLTLLVGIVGISVPSFFIAVFLQAGVIRAYRLSAGVRILPVGGFGWDLHLVLPAIVLMARPLAQISRVTFTTLSRLLEEDFVRTARAKGVPTLLIHARHIFRNAAVPIITAVGVSLRFSLSSLPVIELLFGWPGIGFVFFQGISRQYRGTYQLGFLRSPPAVNLTILVLLGITFMLVNLTMDLLYRVVDPRIREAGTRL
ncbi:MAG: ABC transporter permease [Chloroflexia bacterium]